MDTKEQKEFLTQTRCIAKISTLEKDGSIHTIPVWYMFDGEKYIITSDVDSQHVKNLKRDKSATVLD
jgi:nitroimidazol reductase NimA-like FMN-containing flavoprotein (pyridoxamine 5'-phosphate oxidase superfamily)